MSLRSAFVKVGRRTHLSRGLRARPRTLSTTPAGRSGALDDCPRTKVENVAQKLRYFVRSNRLSEIHKTYPALVETIRRVRDDDPDVPLSSLLDNMWPADILDALAASGRPFDLALVERILSDMTDVFGIVPTLDDHTTIIQALIRRGNIQTIHHWLLSMPRKPGHIVPSLHHWHLFLNYCRDQGELGSLRAAIKAMRRSGCKPTCASYKILVDALFESSHQVPRLADFASIIDEMKQEGLPRDPSIVAAIHRGYTKHGHHLRALQVERLYSSQIAPAYQGQRSDYTIWHKRIEDESHRQGAKAAVKLCQVFQQEGFVASPFTLKCILRNSTHPNDLHHAEKELGVQASAIHWSVLICNAVRVGDVSGALSIYHEAQKFAIIPDAAMVHPIIGALCSTALKPPDPPAIDQALLLYRDLVRVSSHATDDQSPPTNTRHSRGPDISIYNALLRALSSSTNVAKYHPLAMSLLDDMQSRGLSLDGSMTTTSLAILLMRNCSNASEAFAVYRRIRERNGTNIDAKGHTVLLNAFCKMSFSNEISVPSLHHYFEIVKDMRQSGHDLTVDAYTILLRQLAFLATRLASDKNCPERFSDELVAAIRRAHDHLTVDASVSPDTAVWNQLMDTYQRAGCFGEACRVWEMMYLSGTFDNTSVSIILDACGYAKAWPIAAQICLKLLKSGFSFNRKNWNAWVECLCRLGKLNDALKIVCLEMGKRHDSVAPDEDSIRILVNFATKTNQQSEIQSRIKRYLPDLWQRLPPDLRGSV